MSSSAEGQPCAVQAIPSESAFNEHITALPSSCLAVIYFHAPWAEPCKQMSTILSTLASTFPSTSPPRISFLSLDAEEVSDVSENYDVTQVPLVVLQKDGQVVESITGTDAAKVRSTVEKHTSGSAAAGGGEGASRAGLPPAQTVTKPEPSQQIPQDAPASTTNGASAQQSEPEDLNTRLTTLVKAAPVMLFMKGTPSAPQCGFSRQTVSILRDKGVRYGFFNILADDEVRQGLKEYSDWPTFPQVYVGGELVGGLDILKEEFESDPEFLKEYSVHAPAQAA
ncbi:glutaredoxin [Vermiconidia calcicola]|uniref:Glutaredoxin n=1 Tax=Vermiconidia calcicola TaxID=1690605 RepID=A0ACC3NXP5_9PEZI|nr:glutaredoxin [Vermiconidia calcicola]